MSSLYQCFRNPKRATFVAANLHNLLCLANIKMNRMQSTTTYSQQSSVDTSRRPLYPHPKFFCSGKVEYFVKHLKECERQQLYNELQKYPVSDLDEIMDESSATIAADQLKKLFYFNCFPFIGFGFLDNAIMISAGELIDYKIGMALGISTMAAAAIGNLVSDLAGVGLAGYVEVLCCRMGLPVPDLTPQQLELPKSRFASGFGKAFGIAIGCIVGMFPLLLMKEKSENEEQKENSETGERKEKDTKE